MCGQLVGLANQAQLSTTTLPIKERVVQYVRRLFEFEIKNGVDHRHTFLRTPLDNTYLPLD